MKLRTGVGGLALAAALLLGGCGGEQAAENNGPGEVAQASAAANGASAEAMAASPAASELNLSGSALPDTVPISISNNPSEPQYNQREMAAPVGSPLQIIYNNTNVDPHNWVLVEPGQEQAVADAAAAQDGDPAGIPGVIAWSETVSNSTTTVDVPALPAPGQYPYICTVPGHFAAGHVGALNVR